MIQVKLLIQFEPITGVSNTRLQKKFGKVWTRQRNKRPQILDHIDWNNWRIPTKIERTHIQYGDYDANIIKLPWSIQEHCRIFRRWTRWKCWSSNYWKGLWQALRKIIQNQCLIGAKELKRSWKITLRKNPIQEYLHNLQ